MGARKRGRPPGVRPSREDLDILDQVYVWMTWPQNDTKSFDELVYWAAAFRSPREAHRTTLPNRLKRLHAVVAADPAKFDFPEWVSRLRIKGRRVIKPKESGAYRAKMRRGVRKLLAELERARKEVGLERTLEDLKSQTRSPTD
jgi:hypothetical protein